MSEQKIERAKTLMAHGEYAKARAVIASIEHPSKERWLAQIDQRIAHERQHTRAKKQTRVLEVSVAVVIVAVVGVVAVALAARSFSDTQVMSIPTLRVLQQITINTPTSVSNGMTIGSETPVSASNTQVPMEATASLPTFDVTPVNNFTTQVAQQTTPGETAVSVENAQSQSVSTATATLRPPIETVEVPLAQTPSPDQVLRLTRFSFEKTLSGIHSVSLEVQNVSNTTQSGVAWYLLAQPGNTQPWINPAFTSPEQPIQKLAPGQTVTLSFEGVPSNFATGTYSLSAWVHRIDPTTGARTHQDGMGYSEPISIAPPLALEKSDVQVTRTEGKSTISVPLIAHNNTADTVNIALSYTITSSGGSETYKEPLQNIALRSGENYSHVYAVTLPLPTGNYTLTAWLYRYEGDTPKPVAGMPAPSQIVVP